MKIEELLELEEAKGDVRKALAATAVAGSVAMNAANYTPTPSQAAHEFEPDPVQSSVEQVQQDPLTQSVLQKYKISPELAAEVVELAKEHEYDTFPKAADILAIVGIESSFRPHAVSNLKHDPAVGLMQVRPGVWGLDVEQLKQDPDMQIEKGAMILNKYYSKLGSKQDAVHAYNVGWGNFRKGNHNPKYVAKFQNERKMYDTSVQIAQR